MKVAFCGGRMDGKTREVTVPYPIIHINEPAITAVDNNDIEEYELRGYDVDKCYCFTGRIL